VLKRAFDRLWEIVDELCETVDEPMRRALAGCG
jgi:hypothetical protein